MLHLHRGHATVYLIWISTAVGLIPSLGLDKQSPYCSVVESNYPVIRGLDVSWLTYCQQVYGDEMLLDASVNAFAENESSTDTISALSFSTAAGDIVGNEINISGVDNISTISNNEYLRLSVISQMTKQHINMYYENASVKILPTDWIYDSTINNIIIDDTKRSCTICYHL